MTTQLLLRAPPGPDLALAVAIPAAGLLIGRALGVLEFESDVLERERDVRIAAARRPPPANANGQVGHGPIGMRELLMRLGLRDRVQAVVLAYETGLVTPRRTTGMTRDAMLSSGVARVGLDRVSGG